MSIELPWNKMHEIMFDCGSRRDAMEFCREVLIQLDRVIPYDQARLYFIDGMDSIFDEFLIGVEQKWSQDYREKYSTNETTGYSIRTKKHVPLEDRVHDWSVISGDAFSTNYLKPQGILHSFGFSFQAAHNAVRCVLSVDRTANVRFSRREIEIIRHLFPHLNNLYQIFYVDTPAREARCATAVSPALYGLTAREAEVADLLCKGLTPNDISEELCVSIATVKKHIAHMHSKLDVATRQALLVKLLHAG